MKVILGREGMETIELVGVLDLHFYRLRYSGQDVVFDAREHVYAFVPETTNKLHYDEGPVNVGELSASGLGFRA